MTPAQLPSDTSHLEETKINSERIFNGNFVRVNRDVIRLPDGKQAEREYFVHPGAVMMIPLLDDGQVVLERQWRYPFDRAFIEFPAGKIDPEESPIATAIRELREETGYVAEKFSYLCTINNAISYSNEHIDIYLAEGLTDGERKLDDGEFLDVFNTTLQQLLDWVRDGTITDVKTIIGTFWLEKILKGGWQAAAC